ncbi:anthraniloyl-CoA monooxygenase [Pseudonocardia hierapolitana]|uniref:Anthraniloyl-CoA monooxygenase n=1 Tax=Pseudonocardia hierapolitana TaxID=1128676 RepID=A0A561SK42_9PSEU|nr:FAD-dependent monooxygenase [Pseudonocardia hierapolitana]TWF75182.1 anthraniloyl-CoA monooxygenase [Pseudonocardia hierapolitana]
MSVRSIAVVGGGPGGLYAARLLRLADPGLEVVVHEQGLPETTFGFGVALGARTQRNLEAADPDTLADILAAARPHDMSMRVGDAVARVPGGRLVAIARTELLAVLTRHAEKAGVDVRHGARVDADDLDADLVVLADGVSSAGRGAGAAGFGARVEVGGGLYLWAAAPFALDEALFAPATTEHGTFVAHAYPYAPDRSTFLVEVDEGTWRRAGFDRTTDATPADGSDEAALAYLSEAFRDRLGGHPLLGNRTRWLRFRTVTCERWWHGNRVLLGDAAHTAHYSIGSGTKLAMEDAIALSRAVTEEIDRDTALARYQGERKPAVERMQELARRSQRWWDAFPARAHLPVEQLTVAYMSRAGNVSLERFAASTPDVVRAGLAQYAGVPEAAVDLDAPVAWVTAQPLDGHPCRIVTRAAFADGALVDVDDPGDAWGPAADALVGRVASEGRTVWLSGRAERPALLTRLELAERLRLAGVRVVVAGPAGLLPDLAAGLASGRTDLIALEAGA